ncbi:MAG: RNA-binding protein [Chloroflexi bacterium]|nr:RNA-binding protein [Chloroflexota bacterium]
MRSDIEGLFAQSGGVIDVSIPTDRDTGRPRGFAFVEFVDEPSAMKAIEMFDGYDLQGRTLRVNLAEKQQQRPRSFSDSGPSGGGYQGSRGSKPKGSRRNIRAQKRGY